MPPAIHTTNAETGTASERRAAIRDHVLAALADTDADGETVKATVLRELYRQQPPVSLEDTLELNAVVAVPEAGPLTERVETVLSEAVEQHGDWTTTSPAPPTSESTSVPATEGR